jgi:hypothetical protein
MKIQISQTGFLSFTSNTAHNHIFLKSLLLEFMRRLEFNLFKNFSQK